MKRPDPEAYADRVMAEALRVANMAAGIDLETTGHALGYAGRALKKQAKALAETNYDERDVKARCPECHERITVTVPGGDPQIISRALSHTAKMLDDIARLNEFAQGRADSRPESGSGDILKLLPADKLDIVKGWLAELGA